MTDVYAMRKRHTYNTTTLRKRHQQSLDLLYHNCFFFLSGYALIVYAGLSRLRSKGGYQPMLAEGECRIRSP